MSDHFTPLAEALEEQLQRFYRNSDGGHEQSIGLTVQTNSTLVDKRTQPLLRILEQRRGTPSLQGVRIVDMGCGFGALSVRLAFEGATVVGIDLAEERFEVGLAVAERFGLDVTLKAGRIERSGLEPASFDVCIVNNSLCYIINPLYRELAFQEMQDLLRPGGWVLISEPNKLAPLDPFTNLPYLGLLPMERAGALAGRLGRKRSEVCLRSPRGARRELESAGFEKIKSRGASERFGGSALTSRYYRVSGHRPQPS